MRSFITWMESTGAWAPWCFLGLFVAASFLMIWRLEAMTESGVEGTVLGTLVMPYCSGMGNLIFAFVLGAKGGPGAEVLTNSLVNNVTNMTLLIGLPAILWGMNVLPAAKAKKKKPARSPTQGTPDQPALAPADPHRRACSSPAPSGPWRARASSTSATAWSSSGCSSSGNASTSSTCSRATCARTSPLAGCCPFDLAVLAIGAYAHLPQHRLAGGLAVQHPHAASSAPSTSAGSAAG